MMSTVPIPVKPPRQFLPQDFKVTTWDALKPYFEQLRDREVETTEELKAWMKDISEMNAVLSEAQAWRYIKMTIDTTNKDAAEAYAFFGREIAPHLAPYYDAINRKLIEHPKSKELNERQYEIYLRGLKMDVEMYREKNIPLTVQLRELSQKYSQIVGGITIDWEGETLTIQQASKLLKDTDRDVRKKAWLAIKERRAQDVEQLDALFDEMKALRHQIALNADYANYRDYKFDALGRFDYTKQDCFDFHESIATEIVPLMREFQLDDKEKLGVDPLRPWDTDVDPLGREMLRPFENGKQLIDATIKVFDRLDPYFGERLDIMNRMEYLDLESKKGKSPGGYNYPLYEIGVPFIFMNATGQQRDVITMLHEGGHAVHSFLVRELELTSFKSTPSEVAELASMTMELITMDHWDVFYANEEDLNRAKKDQLRKVLSGLPWIGLVSRFQHWIYENPEHTAADRVKAWRKMQQEMSTGVVEYGEYDHYLDHVWHAQLHIFELPFYYIEYGMAQLGAIAIWRNFKQDGKKALEAYKNALALGYTKSIPEIYETAGIRFDFSKEYVADLAAFVKAEYVKLD